MNGFRTFLLSCCRFVLGVLYMQGLTYCFRRNIVLRWYANACLFIRRSVLNLSWCFDSFRSAAILTSQSVPLIIIVGPPRSGTTWLWGLLSSHPDVVAITKDALGIGTSKNPDGTLRTSETGCFMRGLGDAELVDKFAAIINGAEYVIEKTPHHVFRLSRIKRLFPESYVICQRRNVYDIFASMKHYFPQREFCDQIRELQMFILAIEDNRKYIDTYVDYEDLSSNTMEQITRVLRSLELPTSYASNIVRKNARRTLLSGRDDAFRKGVVGDYVNTLTRDELDLVNAFHWPHVWMNTQSKKE